MLRPLHFAALLGFTLTGCASARDQEVFGEDLQGTPIGETFSVVPEAANGDSLFGLWGGTAVMLRDDGRAGASVEYRYRITPSAIAIAARCTGSATAVITVKARVTALEIASLESAKNEQDPRSACEVSMAKSSYLRCESDRKTRCFALTDGTLTLMGNSTEERIVLRKLRD
jgi:hypothetical protein